MHAFHALLGDVCLWTCPSVLYYCSMHETSGGNIRGQDVVNRWGKVGTD
jgi:hypothetical protein